MGVTLVFVHLFVVYDWVARVICKALESRAKGSAQARNNAVRSAHGCLPQREQNLGFDPYTNTHKQTNIHKHTHTRHKSATDPSAVITSSMDFSSHIKLKTRRPISIHPHAEKHHMRERYELQYTTYARYWGKVVHYAPLYAPHIVCMHVFGALLSGHMNAFRRMVAAKTRLKLADT